MKKHYVSYEQSQALKRLGFDWKCDHFYDGNKRFLESSIFSRTYRVSNYWHNFNEYDRDNHRQSLYVSCSAPRLDQAAAWLREIKGVDVLVFNCACGYGWEISKAVKDMTRGTGIKRYDYKGEHEDSGMWLSYESALSAGISMALELLGKEGKE